MTTHEELKAAAPDIEWVVAHVGAETWYGVEMPDTVMYYQSASIPCDTIVTHARAMGKVKK